MAMKGNLLFFSLLGLFVLVLCHSSSPVQYLVCLCRQLKGQKLQPRGGTWSAVPVVEQTGQKGHSPSYT